jgi:hypothetical protein
LITLAQEAAHHLDIERLVPGTDITLHVVLDMQYRAVAGFDRDIIGGGGRIELRAPHVGGKSMHDLE